MPRARNDHLATALPDGRVLISGGYEPPAVAGDIDEMSATVVAELYDPGRRRAFTAGGDLVTARAGHQVFPNSDGSFTICGGTLVFGATEEGPPERTELTDEERIVLPGARRPAT